MANKLNGALEQVSENIKNPFEENTEQKVRAKILYEASVQKAKDEKKASQKKAKDKKAAAEWKVVKQNYEGFCTTEVQTIAGMKLDAFVNYNKVKKILLKSGHDYQSALAEQKKLIYGHRDDKISMEVNNKVRPGVEKYISDAVKIKPSFAKTLNADDEVNHILNDAEKMFVKRVELFRSELKKLQALNSKTDNARYLQDTINQELANIPIRIDETVNKANDTLSFLMGNTVMPALNPRLPEFDPDVIVAQLKAVLNPLISSTVPLQSVVGKIPVLGDLLQIIALLSMGGKKDDVYDKNLEKLKKEYPKPEVPPQLMQSIVEMKDNAMLFAMTLPMIMINVIFLMLNVIYSKLRIITSVIPLGKMFPLNLISSSLTAVPVMLQVMKTFPTMFYKLILGIVKDKMQQALLLGIPTNVGSLLDTMVQIDDDPTEPKKETSVPLDYSDVTKEKYAELSVYGYTEMQLKQVQENYRAINNNDSGSALSVISYEDNGQNPDIPNLAWKSALNIGSDALNSVFQTGAGLADVGAGVAAVDSSLGRKTIVGKDGIENAPTEGVQYGLKWDSLNRESPSPEKYREFFDKLISESQISSELNYPRLYKTSRVLGEWYSMYQDQLSAIGVADELVIKEKLVPSAFRRESLQSAKENYEKRLKEYQTKGVSN